jgi:hypothetical protein
MESKKQNKETKVQTIQRQILEGRKVVLLAKKDKEAHFLVRIRYNNTDTDGTQKWRVIIDDEEYHTSEIQINCPTRTLTEEFEDVGEKHHIVCDTTRVVFENNVATIY